LKQSGLRLVRRLACFLGLFTLSGNALTISGAFLEEVEYVWGEAKLLLGNRQTLAQFHTGQW